MAVVVVEEKEHDGRDGSQRKRDLHVDVARDGPVQGDLLVACSRWNDDYRAVECLGASNVGDIDDV